MPIEKLNSSSFNYQSTPQPAPIKSKKNNKFREEPDKNVNYDVPLSLMADPRVIRGNTHAMTRKLNSTQSAATLSNTGNNVLLETTKSKNNEEENQRNHQATYEYIVKPYAGNSKDLSLYLIEQNNEPPLSFTVESQTDLFNKRPPSPAYVPKKTGIDISTQVDDVRELFDFDLEVAPIVDVIVAKTLEQSLFEVMAECELQGLQDEALKYNQANEEESEWKKEREKKSIAKSAIQREELKEMEKLRDEQVKVRTIIASLQSMKQIIPQILTDITNEFYDKGIWLHNKRVDVEKITLAPIYEAIFLRQNAFQAAVEIADEILADSLLLYERGPCYLQPKSASEIHLTVLLQNSPPPGDGEEVVVAGPQELISLTIGSRDSCISINKVIKNQLQLKNVTLEKQFNLKEYIVAIINREIAMDAPILNFCLMLPDRLQIII